MNDLLYHYRCRVLRVVDGDTLDVEIDLGFRMTRQERIRLLGVNCPEMNTKEGVSAMYAARDWVNISNELPFVGNWPFVIHTSKGDSFGRWLAILQSAYPGGESVLNECLVIGGHAVRTDERGKLLGGAS
jgi:endonuclease YncB( thermonuclease family)